MSKTVFNQDIISAQNSQTVNNLTVNQSLTLTGAPPNELLITDNNSTVKTFTNGAANYIMIIDSNTLSPSWSNDVILNNVQTNTITIPGTTTGDLLVVDDTMGTIDRLPIGSTGNILTVEPSGRPGWQPLIFPNPLTLNNLVVTTNFKIYGGAGKLFVDGSSNVFTERDQIYNDSSIISYPNALVTLSTNSSWNTIAGRRYKLSVNFEVGNTYPSNYSIITLNWNSSGVKQVYSIGPLDCIQMEYIFTETVTGNKNANLVGAAANNSSNGTATNFTWSLISLGN